jgi:hypothetical protein
VRTAHTPTNAKKKALAVASHPKRALLKSGKLVRSPAKDRFRRKTASSNARMLPTPRTPASCETGLSSRMGVEVRRVSGSDSGSTKKPNATLQRARAEAAKAGAPKE